MIATKIRALCEAKGVTVREVEAATGISNGVIRRWDEMSPRSDKLKAVADYFGVTVDELLREEDGE